eukprot:gb/GECG01014411.1/.p1 GENE.gb/GECG01014411.1/~~gb/GECG01014411.1/.p1  ORF type:complete len:406 (+),score=57.26 gb/GECG01014411.1/:1-1218(+)
MCFVFVQTLEDEGFKDFPCRVAGVVPHGTGPGEFNVDDWVDKRDKRTQGVNYIAYALSAAQQALDESGVLRSTNFDPHRSGVSIGSGIGDIQETNDTALTLSEHGGGLRRVSPFFIPRMLVNMAAGNVSINFGLKGPNLAPATACASGAHALGDGFRAIKYGDADVMVAGGTESSINQLALAGFSRARALCTSHNDNPTEASRPFSKGRNGFILGEGAAVFVLEERESALTRGAKIYGEVCGYGMSGDAYHITAPSPEATASLRCMEAATREAGVWGSLVDYVNAHATSTPLGDEVEANGIHQLHERSQVTRSPDVPKTVVASNKGHVGHLLGAAGAVESLFAVLSMYNGILPGTRNLEELDESINTEFLSFPGYSTQQTVEYALSNSFGFGGTNTSLLFRKGES